MMVYDVTIVGAGAAGLIAAYDLCAHGKKVLILEAKNRIGGRAYTDYNQNFSEPVERGAEFVHGKLPISLSLLRKANIAYEEMAGRSYTIKNGKLLEDESFGLDWNVLMDKLQTLETDLTLTEFLEMHFKGDEFLELRESVIKFAQGFDAADPARVSMLSLKKEWMNDHEDNQFRIKGGYAKLMEWIAGECINLGADIKCNHIVEQITHQEEIQVLCRNNTSFKSAKVLVTLPLGCWQNKESSIQFSPALPEKEEAATEMGFGNVIKVTIELRSRLWTTGNGRLMPDAGFIFSDAAIPTWWTQNPAETPQISGWLAGPPADALEESTIQSIEEIAVQSLAYILDITSEELRPSVTGIVVTNWANDVFAKGAYSYETVASANAKKTMLQPVNNKLFLAGEAFYNGSHNGTVEAAFESGRNAAMELIKSLNEQ